MVIFNHNVSHINAININWEQNNRNMKHLWLLVFFFLLFAFLLKNLYCSEASVHTSLITRTPKCEETDYNVLYCYVLCTVLLYWYTILMCWIKSVVRQFLWSHVVMLFNISYFKFQANCTQKCLGGGRWERSWTIRRTHDDWFIKWLSIWYSWWHTRWHTDGEWDNRQHSKGQCVFRRDRDRGSAGVCKCLLDAGIHYCLFKFDYL